MTSRLLSTVVLACLLVMQTAPAPADDLVPPGRNGASPLAPVSLPGTWQTADSLAPQANPTRDAGSTSQNPAQPPQGQGSRSIYWGPRLAGAQPPQPTMPVFNTAVRLPMTGPATSVGGSAAAINVGPRQIVANNGPAVGLSSANAVQPPQGNWLPTANRGPQSPASNAHTSYLAAPPGNGVIGLPSTNPLTPGGGSGVAAVSPGPGQGVDGTWREDGQFVIININGKETKLLKPGPGMNQSAATNQPTEEGTVRGRLAQGNRPLANCHVVMVPIREEGKKAYAYDETREPQTAITDSDGDYFFEHVPAGKYKLTWLPQGTKQWIRRLAIKPDVVVHGGQAVSVREIRAAQSTIN
jgi:hypothetical protein